MILRSSLALLLLVSPAFAQTAQDGPPVDINRMLQELKQIETKNTAATEARRQKILSDIQNASASGSRAVDFYEQATRATTHATAAQFQEWKKKEADKLRSNERQTAAQLHLLYLSISLRRGWGTPAEELLPDLFRYTHQLADLIDDQRRRPDTFKEDLFRKRLGESVFVRWLNVGNDLPPAKEWELVPMNLDGIYEKTILPVMRAQRDVRIVEYWDLRMRREAKQAEEGRLAFGLDQFDLVQKPVLLWSRAKDILAVGQKNRAIGEMFAIIRAYPEHQNVMGWIAELQKLAVPAAPPAPPADAPAPATPAAASTGG